MVFNETLINMDILNLRVTIRHLLGKFSVPADFVGFFEALVRHFAHAAAPE